MDMWSSTVKALDGEFDVVRPEATAAVIGR